MYTNQKNLAAGLTPFYFLPQLELLQKILGPMHHPDSIVYINKSRSKIPMKNVYLLIGAQKAGTTTLYTIFKDHPQINCAHKKESKFFLHDSLYRRGGSFYEQHFFQSDKTGFPYLDVDPDFIHHEHIPERIYKTLGLEARFIVILRDPVERSYSNYLMEKARKNEPLTFFEAIEREPERITTQTGKQFNAYINRSLYSKQIETYLKFYPIEHFRFYLFEEDFIKNKKAMIKSICNYMNVAFDDRLDIYLKTNARLKARSQRLDRMYRRMNSRRLIPSLAEGLPEKWKNFTLKTKGYMDKKIKDLYIKINTDRRGFEALSKDTRRSLIKDYFLDDINRVEKLINRDLSLWKK